MRRVCGHAGVHAPADATPVRGPVQWLRLARLVVVMGGLAAAGDLVLPTHGVSRAADPRPRLRRDRTAPVRHRVRPIRRSCIRPGSCWRGPAPPIPGRRGASREPSRDQRGDAVRRITGGGGGGAVGVAGAGRRRRGRADLADQLGHGARRASGWSAPPASTHPRTPATPAPSTPPATGSCSSTPTADHPTTCSIGSSPSRSTTTSVPWPAGGAGPEQGQLRGSLWRGQELSGSGRASRPRLHAEGGGRQPAGPPERVRAGRRVLRRRAGGRGHRLQLAAAAGRGGGSPPVRSGSSTAIGPRSARCGASGAAMPPAAPGWPAATTASSPIRRSGGRQRACCAAGRATGRRQRRPRRTGRDAWSGAASWPSTRCSARRELAASRCPTAHGAPPACRRAWCWSPIAFRRRAIRWPTSP